MDLEAPNYSECPTTRTKSLEKRGITFSKLMGSKDDCPEWNILFRFVQMWGYSRFLHLLFSNAVLAPFRFRVKHCTEFKG